MNNNKLLLNISNITDSDRQLLNELQTQLDNELKKPVTQQNFDLIDEITETICEIRKENEFIEAKSRNGIEYLKKQTEPVCKKSKLKKWCTILGSCVAVVLVLNVASISAFGKNVFSTAYQIVKGGINIDMDKEKPIELPAESDDPYGMKAKCAEYDMYPLTPTYIPEGFELVNVVDDVNEVFTNIIFQYKDNGIKLNFDFCQYKEGEEIPPIGIPTDTYNIVEEKVNERTMYILKEDNQFTAAFQEDNMVYMIFADGLDYDNCQKVIESLVK